MVIVAVVVDLHCLVVIMGMLMFVQMLVGMNMLMVVAVYCTVVVVFVVMMMLVLMTVQVAVFVFSFHGNLLAVVRGLSWPAEHPANSLILLILQDIGEFP